MILKRARPAYLSSEYVLVLISAISFLTLMNQVSYANLSKIKIKSNSYEPIFFFSIPSCSRLSLYGREHGGAEFNCNSSGNCVSECYTKLQDDIYILMQNLYPVRLTL